MKRGSKPKNRNSVYVPGKKRFFTPPQTPRESDRRPSKHQEWRQTLAKQHGHVCFYCYRNVREGATLDHVMPRSRGGLDIFRNVVLCCYGCNQAKGDKLATEWDFLLAMGWSVEGGRRWQRIVKTPCAAAIHIPQKRQARWQGLFPQKSDSRADQGHMAAQ